ncbi:MAG: hypothetical protein Q4C91_18835 [Eubacteriales bacterium]|nr:hypothetical protein [Eubacteriales bacterium]
MGVLTEAISNFDTSKSQLQDIKETLNLMVELTESKAKEFKTEIENNLNRGRILGKGDSTESLYFPISSVKDSRVEYRCITKDTPTDLIDKITDSICGMIDDHSGTGIVKGIAGIINSAIQPLLGLSEGAEQYCSVTSTFIDGSGLELSISRFDCIIWGRSVSAESIKKQIEKTMACVAYKSVVDVRKITFDDFRSVYSPIVELSGATSIQEAIKNAREIYDLLDGGKDIKELQKRKSSIREELVVKDLISCSNVVMATDGKF